MTSTRPPQNLSKIASAGGLWVFVTPLFQSWRSLVDISDDGPRVAVVVKPDSVLR